ncbi:ATP-binding cassette domain-containing protein [Pyruvatibacter mobilis]|uniref:ATP-binding cassette domain-containing protein n=2 Tax=Pyruvatibacter mobilis TaxID=1712261 RepID=A0A845Q7E4_9HYPH|nr:ABC transporter ATP-binding protein [Pyruvatibacter mobilis]NBG94522.1 ATP-binding cassette domain-containing protein [Pyruvatibacter mobilis]QJD76701.1 ABC transporter ATP-binding protein [Pyruvatibacter mobilis]
MLPQLPRVLLAMLLLALVASTTGIYPLLIEYAIDAIEAGNMDKIVEVPLIIVALVIAKSVTLYLQTVVTSSVVFRVLKGMQSAMFGRLLTIDLARLNREATGRYLSRFTNDLNVVREALTRVMTNGVRDLLTLVFLVGTMIYMDWRLTLGILAIYPLAIVPINALGKRMRRVSADTQSYVGDMTALLNESLSGARMVKTFGLEDYENKRANSFFEGFYRWNMKLVRGRSLVDPGMEILGGVAVAGVVAYGIWSVFAGVGSVGSLMGFLSALLLGAAPARALGTLHVVFQEGMAAVQRVFDLVDEVPAIRDRADARPLDLEKGHVRFADVGFEYEPGAPALSAFSLDVAAGSTVALVGPSGAGKSTVINLIPRLYDATSGAVTIDGQDVKDVTLASLRREMAIVSQDVTLFNDTVRANIAFGKLDATDDEIRAAARAAAAEEFITAMPEGYETVVGDRGLKLSGGQRQRIALARAILRDAPILLLDEATSALDAESERKVQDALETLRHGRTTIVIAHRLATVREADMICVMDQGRVVELGSHDDLVAADGLYARLCKMQYFAEDKVEAAQ